MAFERQYCHTLVPSLDNACCMLTLLSLPPPISFSKLNPSIDDVHGIYCRWLHVGVMTVGLFKDYNIPADKWLAFLLGAGTR